MSDPKKIVVIGAGICGLSSAIWLRRDGHEVTLIDRDGPGAGASSGNAGLLAGWATIPINTPGIVPRAIRYLKSPDQPLFVQWSQMPRMLPWLKALISRSNEADTRKTVKALADLLTDSVDQHHALIKGSPAEKFIAASDFVYTYETRKDFDYDDYDWNLRKENGLTFEVLEGGEVRELEPMLGEAIQCAVLCKNHGHVLETKSYMEALADVLQQECGTYLRAEAKDITLKNGKVSSVETEAGSLTCDAVVLAAGIWSKELIRKLGIKVPLEAERGHHLHLINPSQTPRNPMILGKGKFGVTPMSSGLRCAGTVELGNTKNIPSKRPLQLIQRQITKYLPELEYERAEEWVGFRPSTPDCLPLIGEIGQTGVLAAFGHQHIGLTGGPKTGRILADMIAGRRPNMDLSPFDANRFGDR